VVMILILAGAGLWVWHDHEKDKEKYDTGPENVLFYEQGSVEGNACMIADKIYSSRLVDGRYMIFYHLKYAKEWGTSQTSEVDYAVVNFYDLIINEKLGRVDLTKILNAYLEKGFLWDTNALGRYRTVEGEFYLCFELYGEEGWISVYVNVKTGEVTEAGVLEELETAEQTEEVLERQWNKVRNRYLIDYDKIGLLENIFGERWGELDVYTSNDKVSGYVISIKKGMLPAENQLLYTEFPRLKEYEGSDEDWVYLYFAKDLTGEEILSLFVEEGEEISFEGCVLPAEYSIDGQDHEIHSFEEYEQWVDVE